MTVRCCRGDGVIVSLNLRVVRQGHSIKCVSLIFQAVEFLVCVIL
jgi:hypothetical protein